MSIGAFLDHLADPKPQLVGRKCGGQDRRTFDVAHQLQPPIAADMRTRPELEGAPELLELWSHFDGALLYCPRATLPIRFWPRAEMRADSAGVTYDPSLLRFERIDDWLDIRTVMREEIHKFDIPFDVDGLPIASVTMSGGLFVYSGGAIYYYSPMQGDLHNRRVASSLGDLLAWIVRDPTGVMHETEAVARMYEDDRQYVPERYLSGR